MEKLKRDILQKSSENVVDCDEIREQMRILEENKTIVLKIKKKYEAVQKTGVAHIEEFRGLADLLKAYGTSIINNDGNFAVVGGFLQDLSAAERYFEDIKSDFQTKVHKRVMVSMENYVNGPISTTQNLGKNWDKLRGQYNSSIVKVKEAAGKKKLQKEKIAEVEQERDNLKAQYDQSTQDTLQKFVEVNSQNYEQTLQEMIEFGEAYYEYFDLGHRRMSELLPQMSKLKEYIDKGIIESSTLSEISEIADHLEGEEELNVKKRNTLGEILVLEKNYRMNLNALQKSYYEKLVVEKSSLKMTDEEVAAIFCNCRLIWELHEEIFKELQRAMESASRDEGASIPIGRIFVEVIPRFKIYNDYVNNISNALDTLELVMKNRGVSNFFKTCQNLDTYGNLKLQFLLQAPLKHIQRYEPLLQKIFGQTATTDPDFQYTEDALEMIHAISEMVREGSVRSSNYQKMLRLSRRLVGFEESFMTEGRLLIAEGTLTVITTREKKKKETRKGAAETKRMEESATTNGAE